MTPLDSVCSSLEICQRLNSKPSILIDCCIELYTDESPGLKVDPVIVLVLSLGFIFSVVALHSKLKEDKMGVSSDADL